MRKVLWLVAALIMASVIGHYFSDQAAIERCLEQGGSYHYNADYCSQTQNYQGNQSFIANHKALFVLLALSLIGFIGSLVVRIKPQQKQKSLLMIDNFDSFTYNLVQYFSELGLKVVVKRNHEITLAEIEELEADYIVISPGPCTPDEAGISLELIEQFAGKTPILGVCLGHQAIAQVFGGKVIKAEKVIHGKTSAIFHASLGVFKDLPAPFNATRYHSLIVEEASLPEDFITTAWTQDKAGEQEYIMGIKHKSLPLEGVQFHPESILSEHGHQLLKNFLTIEKA